MSNPASLSDDASDAHLSDHEWRKKQAAEGRALYIYPGMEADMAPKKDTAKEVTLKFSANDAKRFHHAADEVEYLFSAAATAFDTLEGAITGGFLDGDPNALCALLKLCARGMRHARDHEGEALGCLGVVFRDHGVDYGKAEDAE